jgi:hypothetical protein
MERLPYFRLAAAALLTVGAFTPVRAQDADDLKRGVARISVIDGDVSVRRGDSGDWVAAIINAPLLSDDRISTGPNSRAEVQFDSSNVLRIGGSAEVHLAELEYGRYQMEVAHGTVSYVVIRPSSINVEVDTPTVSVRPAKQGTYRITVNDTGETQVISRAGEVEVFTPRGSQWISTGQMMVARGTQADPEFQIVNGPGLDDWDRWNQSRDRALTRSVSTQYVPEGVYGVEDMDTSGTWAQVEDYGYCWRPTVVGAGWAPYRNGRWVWEDWYGWTWVSYDPWGWAPYHYGRWFNSAGNWWWYPGVRHVRHYWSPALVAFFGYGHGGGFGVGFGFGNVGWVPLAPYETFHPWWGRGYYGRNGFDRNINITNINVTNIYRNGRVPNGISGISANDFRDGRFRNVGRVSSDQVREAGLVRGQMPIRPGSSNLRFSDRNAAHVPQGRAESANFFRHQQPSPAQRIPFAQQQRGFEGRTGGSAQPQIPNRGLSQSPPNQGGGAGGWRRFGEPGGQASQPVNPAARNDGGFRGNPRGQSLENTRPPNAGGNQQAPSRGWQRFGEPAGGQRQQPPQSAAPQQSAPRQEFRGYQGGGSLRVAPPVVRERQSEPRYQQAPRNDGPRYSAPQRDSGPRGGFGSPRSFGGGGGGNSAPRMQQSSPRSFGGGGGGGGPRNNGGGGPRNGGGGGRPSAGGGGGNRGHR